MKYKVKIFSGYGNAVATAREYEKWLEQNVLIELISVNIMGLDNKNILVTYIEKPLQ